MFARIKQAPSLPIFYFPSNETQPTTHRFKFSHICFFTSHQRNYEQQQREKKAFFVQSQQLHSLKGKRTNERVVGWMRHVMSKQIFGRKA
jgi:hypothetical protein